jgi:hypothetical protein
MSTPSASVASHRKARVPRLAESRSSLNVPGQSLPNLPPSVVVDPPGKRDEPQPDDNEDPEHQEEENEDDDGYPSLNTADTNNPTESLLPPPFFNPLFTLITDPQTVETHHPSVYYVFSDDAENEREGHDVATIAALTALRDNSAVAAGEPDTAVEDDSETEERFVILDLEPSGDDEHMGVRVKNISSLSPSWAVTSATLRHAPTLDEEDQEDGSLMLRIEGFEFGQTSNQQTTGAKGAAEIKQQAERRAAKILEEARKRGGGSIIDGMGELFKQLNQGIDVVDKIAGETQMQEAKD